MTNIKLDDRTSYIVSKTLGVDIEEIDIIYSDYTTKNIIDLIRNLLKCSDTIYENENRKLTFENTYRDELYFD